MRQRIVDFVYEKVRTEGLCQLGVTAMVQEIMQVGLIQVEIAVADPATGDVKIGYAKRYVVDLEGEPQGQAYVQRLAAQYFDAFTEPLASYTGSASA